MLKKKNRHLISPQFFESRSFKKLGTVPGEHGLFLIMRKFVHAYETSLCSFAKDKKRKKEISKSFYLPSIIISPSHCAHCKKACTLKKGNSKQNTSYSSVVSCMARFEQLVNPNN
jgi:hypothetical protein